MKHYLIYCDESEKKGKYFGNFYGGAVVSSEHADKIIVALNDKKEELNLGKEVKWSRVSAPYLDKYIELVDLFFDFIEVNKVKLRIMFTHNYLPPVNLTSEQKENEFFILYYQFFKNAFGLRYCNDSSLLPVGLKIYFDQLPDTIAKNNRFKDFVFNLQYQFKQSNIVINREDITEVNSKKHIILQCMDVVLGSMCFRLNDLHKEKPQGQRRRGKRTVAKEKLYNHINKRIRDIYPNFNIGASTGIQGDPANRWLHPYRHWKFIPSEHGFDDSKSKKNK